jgi:hypothetical protein
MNISIDYVQVMSNLFRNNSIEPLLKFRSLVQIWKNLKEN